MQGRWAPNYEGIPTIEKLNTHFIWQKREKQKPTKFLA
jgi:hypothetical protein